MFSRSRGTVAQKSVWKKPYFVNISAKTKIFSKFVFIPLGWRQIPPGGPARSWTQPLWDSPPCTTNVSFKFQYYKYFLYSSLRGRLGILAIILETVWAMQHGQYGLQISFWQLWSFEMAIKSPAVASIAPVLADCRTLKLVHCTSSPPHSAYGLERGQPSISPRVVGQRERAHNLPSLYITCLLPNTYQSSLHWTAVHHCTCSYLVPVRCGSVHIWSCVHIPVLPHAFICREKKSYSKNA